ncbi:MAG: PAS domain S-box protein, partial [Candidatus Solibacter sp.]
DCPLHYTSGNAPEKRNVLGTLVLSVLAGHWRYAHINAIRGDGINPELLGMTRVASEDSVRRAMKAMDEAASGEWMKGHLKASYEPLLQEPWVLDVDTTVKPLYGHQEDAKVGYNPTKPGRPSHAYHSYFVANIRMVLDMEVQAGFEALVFKASRGIEDIYELTYIRKDGSRFPAVVSVTALRDDLGGIIGYLLIGTDNTARKQVEAEQKQLDQRLRDQQFYTRSLIESNIDALMTTDPAGIITDVNKQMEALTGCTRDELIGAPFKNYFTDPERAEAGIKRVLSGSKVTDYELTARARDGKETVVSYNATTFHDRDRKLQGVFAAARDVTEHKELEERLRQSQKMDAIGRLAGGVAHDFNNLLTVINGYSYLLLGELDARGPMREGITQILNAGKHAAELTQQLLAFSRRQVLQPKVLDLNLIVADFDRMLRHLVGERIQVAIDCAPDLWQVRADPGEIGRAIMNLAVNARDAMPADGTLTIQTANLTLAEAEAREQDLPPGRYAMLAVRDTGVGMDAQMQKHIFEPFFTTKETGQGTGLGLATVLGIVEQSGGAIRCLSAVGQGTSFRILLPAVAEAVQPSVHPPVGLATAPRGTESIYLVEDEDAVRELVRIVLEAGGYGVIDARNGREGLKLCETHPGKIDLLVTDVVMPELGGRELAEAALKLRPGLKVVFVSGHTEDVILKEGVQQGAAFLHKPFTPMQLAQKVRDTLDFDAGTAH